MALEYANVIERARKCIAEQEYMLNGMHGRSRRSRAASKLRMDRGDFRREVEVRIAEVYEHDDAIRQVQNHISLETNPLQRMTDAVSVAYKVPPVRKLGGAKELTKQLSKALKTARVDATMRRASRIAFQCGVAWVRVYPMPRASGMVPECEIITPAKAVEVWYESDPCHPDVLLATCTSEEDDRIAYVLHDAMACWYLDQHGDLVSHREHGMKTACIAEIRVDDRDEDDVWDAKRNDRLYTWTIDVCRLIAHIRWVRKSQSFKQMVLTGEAVEKIPGGQKKNPDKVLVSNANPDELRMEILDLDSSVRNAEEEIGAGNQRVAESYGLDQRTIDPDSVRDSSSGTMTPREHAVLSDIRYRHIMHLEEGDRAVCTMVARAADVCGMKCPAPDRVAEDIEIDYAPLSFVDHPLEMLKVAAEKIKLGQLDHVQLHMLLHPGKPWDRAEADVMESIEVRNRFIRLLSVHQVPDEPREDGEQVAARQGRQGGLARPSEMGENDDRE